MITSWHDNVLWLLYTRHGNAYCAAKCDDMLYVQRKAALICKSYINILLKISFKFNTFFPTVIIFLEDSN